ncbi:GGDEF domain-containing protein [Cohnella caldifontis]|uniref:GGDEF domain-containing protein n=1 Tax=Cohnella caldifontis TaxID=3027471 RepID=UPI0023EB807A|nr:diguanylate cyclase [Cohnella sp. YIM B05605]
MTIDMISNFSFLNLFLFLYNLLGGYLRDKVPGIGRSKVLTGVLHGLAGILLMFFSVEISPSTIVDMRQIMIVSSSYFGGIYSSLLTALIISVGRVALFGGFHLSSIMAAASAFALALGSSAIMKIVPHFWRKWSYALGLAAAIMAVTLYVLVNGDQSAIPELAGMLLAGGLFAAALVAYMQKSDRVFAELQESEKELRELDSLNESIFRSAEGISIIAVDLELRIARFNRGAELMTGYGAEEAIGRNAIGWLFDPAEVQTRKEALIGKYGGPISDIDVLLFASQSERYEDKEWTRIRKDGSRLKVAMNITPIFGDDGEAIGYLGTAVDINSRKEAEAALRQANEMLTELSFRDGLTGVFNRRYFNEALEGEWKRAQLAGREARLSLLLLDIDDFKKYNDTYGHQMGDECLRKAAQLLKAAARRGSGIVARYGGEEFAVILPDTDTEGALLVAEWILKAIAEEAIPHSTSRAAEYVTFSIGAATSTGSSAGGADALIAQADQALYEAKAAGRNRVMGSQAS